MTIKATKKVRKTGVIKARKTSKSKGRNKEIEVDLNKFEKKVKKIGAAVRTILQPIEGGSKFLTSKTKLFGALKPTSLKLEDVDAGYIITFKYYGKDAHDPTPVVLVFSPKPFKKKLHGINLKYLPVSRIRELVDIVNEGILDDLVYNPKLFYAQKIKGFLREIKVNELSVYRTYRIDKIRDLKIYTVSPTELEIIS